MLWDYSSKWVLSHWLTEWSPLMLGALLLAHLVKYPEALTNGNNRSRFTEWSNTMVLPNGQLKSLPQTEGLPDDPFPFLRVKTITITIPTSRLVTDPLQGEEELEEDEEEGELML
ncbi:hypothetical protein SKAU_G00043440 [Synaphobranchus kaupii]|uniref:Uncharacterized protein n=1 Tax=Synaphobranchus kaupii TaxID=118154 RepID=A0A9Q1G2K6_SYNKA|nr:hypothetical protein SKAU_G00043440 [Synaphobranchus kaupii]